MRQEDVHFDYLFADLSSSLSAFAALPRETASAFSESTQAGTNSLVSAIGVPSPDSTLPDKKPETFSSKTALTLIESRPARSRLARNSTDAPSKE